MEKKAIIIHTDSRDMPCQVVREPATYGGDDCYCPRCGEYLCTEYFKDFRPDGYCEFCRQKVRYE